MSASLFLPCNRLISCVAQLSSVAQSCPTPWTAAHQASLSFTLGACSNTCPLSQWCYPTISSSGIPFSSCLHSSPASGSFPMSQLFTSGGQRFISTIFLIVGEGGGRTNGESSTDLCNMYTLPGIKNSQWEAAVITGSATWWQPRGVGWVEGEVQEGRNIIGADLHCCMAEANTLLWSNYPPIKMFFN